MKPIVWVARSLERISRQERPRDETRAQLRAARGESESFQIVVRALGGDLTTVNVTRPELVSAAGDRIARERISLYREQYVTVSHGSPKRGGPVEPLGPGTYPDALIPFHHPKTGEPLSGAALTAAPFDLGVGENQPIWVDVGVPRETAPGEYCGSFTVSSDQGSAEIELRLRVWNFDLPLRPSQYTAFGLRSGSNRAAVEELLRHKVMPYHVDPPHERELIDQSGLNCTNLGFRSGGSYSRREMSEAPTVDEIRTRAGLHQQDLLLYNYTADEIGGSPELHERIKGWARNLHEAKIPNLITIMPVPDLVDDGSGSGRSAVDIWVLLPVMYDSDPEAIAQVLAKGDTVWSYTALVQDDYSPKWEIDFEPINYRILHGFINQSLGLTGYLYWAADLWSKDDPWSKAPIYGLNDARYEPHTYPGEGHLVYPGEQVGLEGVVASMRLKWVRDGMDDYEYVEMLKRLGQERRALEVARTVGRDWRHWTKDPDELERAKAQLGEEIEQLTTTSA